jgi:hypothetical protein
MRPIIAGVLTLWFVAVFLLGAAGAMAVPAGTPPFPILIAATAPVIVFLVAYRGWPAFRASVRSLDLSLATSIQAWRAAGLGFLALYAHGVLPGAFAWPAGLGDIAIGVTAPWVARALVRRPGFAISPVFLVWNLLGILDLIVALSVGGLSSALASGAAGEVTTGPMARLPLVLIPAYLVPLFVMLHLAALFQARRPSSSMVQTSRPGESSWLTGAAAPDSRGMSSHLDRSSVSIPQEGTASA